MNRAVKAIAIILVVILLFVVAVPVILSLTGISVKRADGARKQISRMLARNFHADIKDIPKEEKGYYYEQLIASEQSIYHALYSGVTEDETQIEVPGSSLKTTEKVWNCLMSDHPEFFWLTGGIETTTHEPPVGRDYSVVEPEWTCTKQEAVKRRQEVENVVAQYLEKYGSSGSDYDRIKAAYDYIVDTTAYDKSASDNQNLYSVLVSGRSVCAGYSKAFQYLLKRQGIPCIYVTGTDDKSKEGHAWNIVSCNGHYYHVDVTWGDPLYVDGNDALPENRRLIGYDYMCCTDREILQTHTIDKGMAVPVCDYDDLNYYKMNGLLYESYDRDQCRHIIFEDVDAGKEATVFKFADSQVYEEAHDELIDTLFKEGANRILTTWGLRQVYTYYQDEKDQNKIILYWQYQ